MVGSLGLRSLYWSRTHSRAERLPRRYCQAESDLAQRPFVLDDVLGIRRLVGNRTDMEFIGALQRSVEEVPRAFGVPKAFLSEYDGATLAGITVMEQMLWRNTVIPELRMLEERFNLASVPGYETGGDRLVVRIDLTEIEAVQESESEKAERLSKLVKDGIMTVEEARVELGL